MTFSGLTNKIRRSPQNSSRNGARIDHIILHHTATTNVDWVVNAMVSGSKQVSANYVVGNDGTAYGIVDEERRAWTSSSASWDGRSITFEIVNSTTAPSWSVSQEAHEKVAQLCADFSRRYNFPLNRSTVLGHRELYSRHGASYPTACPGGLNMDWIVDRANRLLGSSTSAAVIANSSPAPSASSKSGISATEVRRVATYLNGRKLGKTSLSSVDGKSGPVYWWLIQTAGRKDGLYGEDFIIDGEVGNKTLQLEKHYRDITKPKAAVKPVIKSKPVSEPSSSSEFAYWEPNGKPEAKRVQRALKAKGRYAGSVDGIFGPETRKGIQKTLAISGMFVGPFDGVIEGGGCEGIQKYAKKFGSYTGPIDKKLGLQSWIGFALGLERP